MLDGYKIFFIFSSILVVNGRNLSINTENALIGDLRGQIISTTHLLEDATYRIKENPALWDILVAPIRRMLNKLTPSVGNSMIGQLLTVTGKCADSQVKLHIPDIDRLIYDQKKVYTSLYDACEAYLESYEGRSPYSLSSRRPLITDEAVYRSVHASMDYITASMMNFQRGGFVMHKTFLDNFDTLSDLPKETYESLYYYILHNSYGMLDLCRTSGQTMTRIADRTKSVSMKKAADRSLESMGRHVKNVVAYAKRTTDRYRKGERELAAKVTDWTKKAATASADDAKAMNTKIVKAKDIMEKYIATRGHVDIFRGYGSSLSYKLRAPIAH